MIIHQLVVTKAWRLWMAISARARHFNDLLLIDIQFQLGERCTPLSRFYRCSLLEWPDVKKVVFSIKNQVIDCISNGSTIDNEWYRDCSAGCKQDGPNLDALRQLALRWLCYFVG